MRVAYSRRATVAARSVFDRFLSAAAKFLVARGFATITSMPSPHGSRKWAMPNRRALYMPALVAVQHEARVMAFFDHLVARGKKSLQA